MVGESLHKPATEHTKSELLEVCSRDGHPGLKGAQVVKSVVSGSLGSQKEQVCLSRQSSQALEQGSQQRWASPGVGSLLSLP